MTIRIGVDCEQQSNLIADMDGFGAEFVCRYLSDYPSGKNLTRSEAAQILAAGKMLVSNWEDDTNDGSGGFQQGVDFATRANAQHLACGGGPDDPIYFSVDRGVGWGSTLQSFFQGINSVIGVARTGAYADTAVLEGGKAAGVLAYTWRSMSTGWPGGSGGDSEFNIEQTGFFNNSYDRDASFTDDFGQWGGRQVKPTPAPAPVPQPKPVPTSEEDAMQQIEPVSAHPGLYNFPTVNKGHFRLTVGDGGTATVRVVAWNAAGNALVLCGDKGDGYVKKGARDFLIDPGTVSHVTVQRTDSGNFPVGAIAY
jgi:hypothetical protein